MLAAIRRVWALILSTVGDRIRRPALMTAPCPHCEQIRVRGNDALVART
jgi:hypothetical protein